MTRQTITILLIFFSFSCNAQQIKIGTWTTRDGGAYTGEIVSGKAHGKGTCKYPNGNTYEGEYVKGKRQGKGN